MSVQVSMRVAQVGKHLAATADPGQHTDCSEAGGRAGKIKCRTANQSHCRWACKWPMMRAPISCALFAPVFQAQTLTAHGQV